MDILDNLSLRNIHQRLFRNVPELPAPAHPFDDLAADALDTEEADAFLKRLPPVPDEIDAFYHAIGYPFDPPHFTASRYSDGTFPVWYGALTSETTIYETAYHMVMDNLAIEGLSLGTQPIICHRHVYRVPCQALLIDLVGLENQEPRLVADDHRFCQQLARRLQAEGHPGLLAPSARTQGTNAAIFNQSVLGATEAGEHLTYVLRFADRHLEVRQDKAPPLRIEIAEWLALVR
ncbi:RES family NAD+ phosphorylase [Geoalkalibacter halelectricus]|uniref:RES family NAD+ phosphorylase n=1 Tax=Geoalkalibacter halelectricus TaxID=2847045 RepID=A0ABY5ZK52_9BACT|nr:RES family NAD+ phosphorylase [Geoalkalibacter halelectricus]MDO3377075.1 RES family NAD+ phosphorylase [Geoalkalibacter halelectricus]UWZ79428.1 RES family NAD+ phosphorylase [Geoalkalibacter halelectricus]